MHDILEGALPYNVKLLLNHIIEAGFFTFTELSNQIAYLSYGPTESKNKPAKQDLQHLRSDSKTALNQNGKNKC